MIQSKKELKEFILLEGKITKVKLEDLGRGFG